MKHVTGVLGGPRAMLFRNGTHVIDIMNFLAGGTADLGERGAGGGL